MLRGYWQLLDKTLTLGWDSKRWTWTWLYKRSLTPIKLLLWFGGIYAIGEKFITQRPDPERPKAPTLLLWIFGLYSAFFGIVSQRYENRVDLIETKMANMTTQLSTPMYKKALSRIPHIQRMPCPIRPDFTNPISVISSFLHDTTYIAGVEELKSILEVWSDSLRMVDLREVNLNGADLTNANLQGADLRKADLLRANLNGANLREANLMEACLIGARLWQADLWKANLVEADLRSAFFSRANLYCANLYEADLLNANLFRADLRGAILSGADLSETILIRADLRRASLEFTNLDKANLKSAKLDIDSIIWAYNLNKAIIDRNIINKLSKKLLTKEDTLILYHDLEDNINEYD